MTLQPQQKAPEFKATAVIDGAFKDISLSDYLEIVAFSDRVEEFKNRNCEVMACSTDAKNVHLAWINTPRDQGGLGPMKIPLIADRKGDIAKAFGVFQEETGNAFRGLFIINDKGVLRQVTINDMPVGRDVDETLRLLDAFIFTDKHGEVCPANWRPGKKTMAPTREGVAKHLTSS